MDLGRGRDLASYMNPDSTDLENRGRTAETLRESKNDKELVWKNITLWVEKLGRSRRGRAPKNFARIAECSGFVKKPKRYGAGYQVIVWIACRSAAGMSRIVRLAAIVSSSDDGLRTKAREFSAVRFGDRIHATSDSQSDPDTVEAMSNRPTRALSVASVKEGATVVLAPVRDSGIVLGWVASGVRATFPVPIPAASGLVS
jgi:hypothetical protein